jgi:hypothetical protein
VLRLFPCTGPTPRLHLLQEKEEGVDASNASPHSHCFSLAVNSHTEREEEWRLCAASQEELDAWVHALSPYVIISGGGQQQSRGECFLFFLFLFWFCGVLVWVG